ncbi:hypothetical protein [Pseudaminobacter soli (ex Zhang et al. 2022)]|nr:hypothetical protein [Pseudaminobacter soli]
MRYVIAVMILTGLIIWDGAYYNGRYLAKALGTVNSLVHSVTG